MSHLAFLLLHFLVTVFRVMNEWKLSFKKKKLADKVF
jgi:hypothetical protein